MGGVDGWLRWLASNGGVDGWRRWMAPMVGFERRRRWMASMVGVYGWRRRWTGVFDTEGTDVDSVSPVVRVTRTVVACSSSEQFAGYQWLLSLCLVIVL